MTDHRFTIHNLVCHNSSRNIVMYWKRQNSTFVIHSLFVMQFFNVNIYKSWIYLWWWKLIWKAKKSSSSMVSSALFSGIKNSFAFLIIIRQKRHLFWRNKYFHCFSLPVSLPVLFFLFSPFSFSFLPFSRFSSLLPPFPFFFLSFPILVSEGSLPPRGYHLETGYGDVRPLRHSFHALSAVP